MTDVPRAAPKEMGEHLRRPIVRSEAILKQNTRIAFGRARLRAAQAGVLRVSLPVPPETRDFFISHAGEDRPTFVERLVQGLVSRGRSVWYSDFELTVGDSLLGKIDGSLRSSRFGVVVLSEHFFRKPWTRAELDGLFTRATVENRKVNLPVWHGLGHAEIAARSPLLAGLLGIPSSEGVTAVADAIVKAADRG